MSPVAHPTCSLRFRYKDAQLLPVLSILTLNIKNKAGKECFVLGLRYEVQEWDHRWCIVACDPAPFSWQTSQPFGLYVVFPASMSVLRHNVIPTEILAHVEISNILLGRRLADLQGLQESVRMRLEDIDPATIDD